MQSDQPRSRERAGDEVDEVGDEEAVVAVPAAGPNILKSAQKKAYDLLIQAESGLISVTGEPVAEGFWQCSSCRSWSASPVSAGPGQ